MIDELNEHNQICISKEIVKTKRTNSDGRFSYRYQCKSCGYSTSQAIKKPIEDFIEPFDEVKYQEAKETIYNLRNRKWIEQHTERHIEFDYNKYLQTPEWISKRGERLIKDSYRCVFCGNKNHLHVHHKTYTNLMREDVDKDLITLCKVCHEKVHNLILYKC